MINLFEQSPEEMEALPPDSVPQDQEAQQQQPPPQEVPPSQGGVPPGQDPGMIGGVPPTPVAQQGGEIEDDPPELTPLKKYYLIEKLYILKNKLNQFNLNNDDLDRVLKFANSFSYETLVSLSEKLAKNTESILREEKLNRGKNKNEK